MEELKIILDHTEDKMKKIIEALRRVSEMV